MKRKSEEDEEIRWREKADQSNSFYVGWSKNSNVEEVFNVM